MNARPKKVRLAAMGLGASLLLTGCGFSPFDLPLPGGADLGDNPYEIKVQFRDVLDLVPQSSVKVNELSVGRVSRIKLDGWTAEVTLKINGDVELPDNAEATLRQTSLLGEKFVSLAPPKAPEGTLGNGDVIALEQSGRNPEIEEVLGAASLLLNGGGIEKTRTIVRELNNALEGREPEVKELITRAGDLVGQLDENKTRLIGTLEQINRLAVETNKQTDAIVTALDEVPEALDVVNDQRDELVELLESLERLGEVGVDVVNESKDAFVRDLELLEPTLRELANAGDSFPEAIGGLVSFPFVDGFVGGNVQSAKNTHIGDYNNLSIRLDLKAEQLTQFLDLDGLAAAPGSDLSSADGARVADIVDLLGGLNPSAPEGDAPSEDSPDAPDAPLPGLGGGGGQTERPREPSSSDEPQLCSMLGLCRAATGGAAQGEPSDVGKLLLTTVVAK